MKLKFWKSNKSDHDCKEHCGHAQILDNIVHEHSIVDSGTNVERIRPKEHEKLDEYYQKQSDFESGIAYLPEPFLINIKHKNQIDFVKFLKEVMKIKKYQLLAKKYNLEFEFGEDV